MAKDFFIKIDSKADIKPLYEELCALTGENKNEARRVILGFKGSDKSVNDQKITLDDIVTFCAAKRFTFEFKVNYTDPHVTPADIKAEVETLPGSFGQQSNVYSEMEKQREVLAAVPPEPPVDPPKLPEIPDFNF